MQKNPHMAGSFAGLLDIVLGLPAPALRRLEAEAVVLDARIRNPDEPHRLVAGGDVGHVDAQGFQAVLELLDGKGLLAVHVGLSFVVKTGC
jgi:hypothetical protein